MTLTGQKERKKERKKEIQPAGSGNELNYFRRVVNNATNSFAPVNY